MQQKCLCFIYLRKNDLVANLLLKQNLKVVSVQCNYKNSSQFPLHWLNDMIEIADCQAGESNEWNKKKVRLNSHSQAKPNASTHATRTVPRPWILPS